MDQQLRQQESQENEIGQLIKTVGNIKQLGKNIGGELITDLKILQETEEGTDKNMTRMKRAQANIVGLLRKTNNCCLWSVVVVQSVLFVLIVSLF